MKYGLILNFATDNIGDDIQSYAAAQFLPSIDCVIDRESLDRFDNSDEPVKAIMNGWYMYDKFNWPPSADIDPLWVSVHISEADNFGIGEKFLSGPGGEYLRQYAPIGARDESTLEMFRRNGIDAELTMAGSTRAATTASATYAAVSRTTMTRRPRSRCMPALTSAMPSAVPATVW